MPIEGEELLSTRRFRVIRQMQRTADGRLHARETVQHPGAVAVLPILDGNRVCLIQNYRIAVDRTLIELPAGTLEPGDEPSNRARLELAEETGYRADEIRLLTEFCMSPGILNERTYLYLATGLTAGEQALEPGEEIQRLVVPLTEALAMVDDGRIEDAKTLIGLMFYERLLRNG